MEELDEETMEPGQLIHFVQHVFELEYAALVANYSEKSDVEFSEKYEKIRYYISEDVDIEVHRPIPVTEDWLDYNKSLSERVRKRRLFAIKIYDRPGLSEVYRAYVGPWNDWFPDGSYVSSYFFAFFDGKMRLFSIYDRDIYPERLGHRIIEENIDWVWSSGVEISDLGEPTFLLQIEPPTDEKSLQEYNTI